MLYLLMCKMIYTMWLKKFLGKILALSRYSMNVCFLQFCKHVSNLRWLLDKIIKLVLFYSFRAIINFYFPSLFFLRTSESLVWERLAGPSARPTLKKAACVCSSLEDWMLEILNLWWRQEKKRVRSQRSSEHGSNLTSKLWLTLLHKSLSSEVTVSISTQSLPLISSKPFKYFTPHVTELSTSVVNYYSVKCSPKRIEVKCNNPLWLQSVQLNPIVIKSGMVWVFEPWHQGCC